MSFKNKFIGKRCFIVGNGPSIKKLDLSKLSNEYVFITNWFVINESYRKLKKAYHCMSDPHLWNYGEGLHKKLINMIVSNKNVKMFYEDTSQRSILSQSTIDHNDVCFIKVDYSNTVINQKFCDNILYKTNWGHTVIIDICIPTAYYMGFTDIYIIGVDLDYKLNEDKNFSKSFFYDISEIPKTDLEYIKKQRDNNQAQEKYNEWIAAFSYLNNYFNINNRKLYNATSGGKLDVLDRVDYNSLF